MGEFKVHRVRFFDFMPSGIRCMAFNSKADRLALARLDGTVEIFNFSNNYFQEKVIPGNDSRSIEAICWVGCDRLFTAGLNGEVVEYDLERLCPKYTLDAFGGPIWTAACNSEETHFALGCEDGSVKLFEILPDKIQFERNLDRQKGRILSLSWHKSGTLIAAGSLDVIRVFDVKSGHSVQRILVDRGSAGTCNKDCVVWNVAFLSDYTIVSGDSAGKVQLWDANKGTLIKTHLVSKWDVLSLSVSENEDSIVAGTSEGTVVQFQLLSPKIGDTETQWVRTRIFKHHTHDVRAVTQTRTAVVSGGLDTQLVICPLMDKVEVKSSESVLRKVIFPHRSLVSCAKKPSLLLFQFPDQLELWRLGGTDTIGKPGESLPVTRKPEKLLQLKRKGDDHICCSTISECGHWIAYSTVSSIRLYQLQCENNIISITKVSKLPKVLRSAHQLQFSADSSKLFVASERATIHVISLSRSECKHVHTFKPKSGSSAPVHLVAASADGKWLTSANRHCEVNVYNLKKLKHHCTVPVYNSLPSAMAVHPETNNLLITHADQQMFEFSIVDKQYTDWSRKLQKEGLHKCRLKWGTPITHIAFNPQAPSQVILHDMHMFCIIDQSLPLDGLKAQFYSQLTSKDVSESDRPHKNNALKICNKYQPLLHVNLLEDDWLVVVERPLIDIHSQLPAPVRQKKFGT
ncbi:U3 small nucleolar RNA-associated protein 4 homolog [Polyodon spathula]|uniref:U3 small nucleolar RNA-associated protein 4 homolog n=1 Tax=Polyodon spathula TaxID=7913 RepID=UPI001B7DD404|nr:U3 small nucleolar RNA-associated protein 4 homolog [Polyodon spathula]XP_041124502.1 U3 small nucleolar RNA-associated protein 4 homolog [Polyodon spathula]